MRTIKAQLRDYSKNGDWIQLNPYEVLGDSPKKFTAQDLHPGEVLKLNNAYVKVIDFGGACLFGKDSYSYMMIKIKQIKYKLKNPNRYYILIDTRNPAESCGGVQIGGWYSSVEDVIINKFPRKHSLEGANVLYNNKTLKIIKITKTDFDTGDEVEMEIKDKYNAILNNLK